MNRRDDYACLCVSHARLRATRGQADKGTSKGAVAFMNNAG